MEAATGRSRETGTGKNKSRSAGALDQFIDTRPQNAFLKSKFQVGSCKSDRVNFRDAQKVFHSGDVPPSVLAAKKDVVKSKRPDILCVNRQPWDQTTIADPKIQKPVRKQLKRELLLVRAGLLDQPTVAQSKGKSDEEIADYVRYITAITGKGPVGALTKKWFNATDERGLGAHTIEPGWADWNCSVGTRSAEDVKIKEKRFAEDEARRIAQNVPDAKIDPALYRGPVEQVGEFNALVAEKKNQYQDLKEEFKAELRNEFPTASEERMQAIAARLLDEKLLADERTRRYPIPHESFQPNLALTCMDRRYKEWRHPGKWEWRELEQMFCWSCCMNYKEESKGCEYRTVNPDAWCYFAGGLGRT